jgi:hypothetical protein
VFSRPGKSQTRDTNELIDGSPDFWVQASPKKSSIFSSLYFRCRSRTSKFGSYQIVGFSGASERDPWSCKRRASKDSESIKLLWLTSCPARSPDPHNLGTLSFDLFEALAKLKKIDIIVHVSLSDLQRNVDRYTSEAYAQFDRFAPGWRENIRVDQNQTSLRAAILKYWTEKVVALGLPRAKLCELILITQAPSAD